MTRPTLADCIEFVTTHNRIVVLAMLVLTAGMAAGITAIDTEGQAGGDDFPETEASRTADSLDDRYGDVQTDEDGVAYATVYVRAENGDALSKAALLDTLRYQRAVTDDDAVAPALATDGDRPGGDESSDAGEPAVRSVAMRVTTAVTDDPTADLGTRIEALESMNDREVAATVERILADDPEARQLVGGSDGSEPTSAESQRLVFAFAADEDGETPGDAQRVLYDEASDRDGATAVDLEYFTLGEHAVDEWNAQLNQETTELLVPLTLAVVLVVLTVTYRDPIDVVVGMVGVVTAIVWMFGVLGWLGVDAGMTMFIGPVLIAGLSIDFGFHVFMRYRERRASIDERAADRRGADDADDPIRRPMTRAIRSLAVALGLVTLTTGIGFLSNVVNPVGLIRDLGIGITLGVLSAFVVFVTLVPALKISLDGLCERVGIDRRKRPLGAGSLLGPALRSSVVLARRAAPLIVVVALLAGAGGAVAWTALDEEGVQRQEEPAAEWKGELPEPLAWEDPDYQRQQRHVQEAYRPMATDDGDRVQLLIEGDVTDDGTLLRIQRGLESAGDWEAESAETAGDGATVPTPLTLMKSVAAEDESFAATLEAADTNGDGVPDSDLETVYDEFYATAPDEASRVIERSDGEYRSLRVLGPPAEAGVGGDSDTDPEAVAAAIEAADGGAGSDGDDDLSVTAVSESIVEDSQLAAITDGVLQVLVLALAAVFAALVVVYRYVHGSATLGAVTGVPIALVTGLVVGGMYLLAVPLTLLTALLMSLVIGLGIDYAIHVSDRFARELEDGRGPFAALEAAVVGTGGALLGSTLTSAGAFAALLLHPHPQLESFGTLVVLALVTAFVVSVFVLPSLLALWVRYGPLADATEATAGTERTDLAGE